MNVAEYVQENYQNDPLILVDGFDDAFIGIGYSFNTAYACYNMEKVLQILMEDGMSYDEAVEYFEFNIVGAYVGENTPVFISETPKLSEEPVTERKMVPRHEGIFDDDF